ncbi:hypothetical protein VNO78_23039 [Psophocarpus tetragonolobus]|uniref:Uncharacterized protein n=1 Tax=Psophocarpus tetragonolobus TaxID=3891 RepID=A0AAN9XCT2_PSOTE
MSRLNLIQLNPVHLCKRGHCEGLKSSKLAYDLEKQSGEAAANFVIQILNAPKPISTPLMFSFLCLDGEQIQSLLDVTYSYDLVGKPIDVYDKLRAPLGSLFFG